MEEQQISHLMAFAVTAVATLLTVLWRGYADPGDLEFLLGAALALGVHRYAGDLL